VLIPETRIWVKGGLGFRYSGKKKFGKKSSGLWDSGEQDSGNNTIGIFLVREIVIRGNGFGGMSGNHL
jgi:hypothetical protein